MKLSQYLNETKIMTAEYIDLANPGNNSMSVPGNFKPEIPSKKTMAVYDEVMLAGYTRWGSLEKFLGSTKVQVNMNPGMGNRAELAKVKFDQVVAWRYSGKYEYINSNRIIK